MDFRSELPSVVEDPVSSGGSVLSGDKVSQPRIYPAHYDLAFDRSERVELPVLPRIVVFGLQNHGKRVLRTCQL